MGRTAAPGRTCRGRVGAVVAALGIALPLVAVGGRAPARAVACPSTVDAAKFASAQQLRALTTKLAGFGLRSPASTQHQRELAWLEHELRGIPGMQVHSDPYTIDRWQPLPEAHGRPGRDLARAGGLTVAVGGA